MTTTLSVVQYTSPHKSNILQQSSNTNDRREIIILRKNQNPKEEILLTNTAKKRPKPTKEPTRVHNPPPMAVARRNARERNRVKQVNNGFANLRQHIPNSIAAAFESNTGRGGNKKLSKVETLRMAVEYIRSLEDLLSLSESDSVGNVTSCGSSISSYPSPSSPMTIANMPYAYPLMSPSEDDDDLSTNPTPPPQQFVRINGTNAYQIIPAHLYDDENLEPLEVDDDLLADPALIDTDLELNGVQDLSLLNSINTNASLSPEMYSDNSMSPKLKNEAQSFIQVFNTRQISPDDLKIRINPRVVSLKPVDAEPPVISLPSESEISEEQQNNMIEVMNWWEQQTTRS